MSSTLLPSGDQTLQQALKRVAIPLTLKTTSGRPYSWHRRQEEKDQQHRQAGEAERVRFSAPWKLTSVTTVLSRFKLHKHIFCLINIKREALLGPSAWPCCKTKPHSTGPAEETQRRGASGGRGPAGPQTSRRPRGGTETLDSSSFVFPFISRPNDTFP